MNITFNYKIIVLLILFNFIVMLQQASALSLDYYATYSGSTNGIGTKYEPVTSFDQYFKTGNSPNGLPYIVYQDKPVIHPVGLGLRMIGLYLGRQDPKVTAFFKKIL